MTDFGYGDNCIRQRRKMVPDAVSGRLRPGDWADADELELPDAYVASSSSRSTRNETRNAILTAKSLFVDPELDVQAGDRIRVGSSTYIVEAKPEADRNPFTGWEPAQEIPLKEVSG